MYPEHVEYYKKRYTVAVHITKTLNSLNTSVVERTLL